MISPTGGGIRNDDGGSGLWLAKRGLKLHQGVDYELPNGPGQLVVSPITGILVRIAYPYSDTQEYSGCEIRGADIWIKMFYLRPYDSLIGQEILMGQPIGIAQDIGKRYKNVIPHIHLEASVMGIHNSKLVRVRINPLLLMNR